MLTRKMITALGGVLVLSSHAAADVLVESYEAVLSKRDHFNSAGERLDNVAAIIRQDRANFHKFGKRDEGDHGDTFFSKAKNREILERLLQRGRTTKAVMNSIVNGTPVILVRIYENDAGENYINVLIEE